jgi:transcriptional regulator with XRE-family HTH domain
MSTRELLAKNLRAIRNLRGLRQGDLGSVPQTTVSRLERGENAADIDTLADLAKALQVDVWVLLAPDLDPDNLPVKTLSHQEAQKNEELKEAARKIAGLQ